MNEVYLSIGTNIGEREKNLQQAVQALMEQSAVQVKRVSSIYETAAVGYTEQADFLNIAVAVESPLMAQELLEVCQSIENELGRVREMRWGPRIIDLDILLYNHENIETESLIIPHPRMYERAFVLVPLQEIAPSDEMIHEKSTRTLQAFNIEQEGVKLWKKVDSVDEFMRFESLNEFK
ncbi:2-amino-4-hydroxy-6-hydroxymethyldihydropteridine diphosphokinase [Solibacillus sp. R5-41]|uniref:2-amino-4-hydroxy-6- hydroxymethyldihydropteridine diphosphokinase n=1 Tax=Solibacillus sp. R5-41 TaxID=2048654 RepID=UPI000C126926|nr:2-amino-4-hydroxy-6-hydroxymethyldihydropteridine diphosphokinase [Solibacillus sp. R5-41]ATP38639.1 2-amino-4-hydroxy-6-hydroxymethyldihydropteridine diphosphokinase [Solibacillus sp. R5-41]